jgi:hypothetical protein
MNTQNMTIEQAFMANVEVKRALNVSEYQKIAKVEATYAQKTFEKTMAKAAIIGKAVSFLESKEGELALANYGLKWSAKDLFENVYGVTKSTGHKYNRASKIDREKVTEYITRGGNLSLEGLLSFVNSDGRVDTDTPEGEGEGTAKAITILTLAYKGGDSLGNVSIRVDSEGKQVVTGSPEALKAMQSLLNKALMDAGKK